MKLSRITILLCATLMSMLWGAARCQVTQVSNFEFNDTKVLLLDLDYDVMLVVTIHWEQDLQMVQVSTGEVIQTLPGRGHSLQKTNDGYLIRSRTTNPRVSYLRYYHQGTISTLMEDIGFPSYPIAEPIPSFTSDWFCTLTSEGLTFTNGQELIFSPIDSLVTYRGLTADQGRLFAYFDDGYAEIDPTNFEVISEHRFPEGLRAHSQGAHGAYVLLTKSALNVPLDLRVANLLNGEIVDAFNSDELHEGFEGTHIENVAMDGEYAIFGHNIFMPYHLHFTTYRGAVTRIHLPSATGAQYIAEHTYRDVPTPIPLSITERGVIAFGNFKLSGIEPYLITDSGPELIADIHPGVARSIEVPAEMYELWNLKPFSKMVRDGKVYFVANHPREGREIWASDGSSEGTRMVCEFYQGPRGTSELFFTPSTDDQLYAVSGAQSSDMRLYHLEIQHEGIEPIADESGFWQRSFGFHDAHHVSTRYPRIFDSKPKIASDGSVASLFQSYDNRNPWIALDAKEYLPEGHGTYNQNVFSALHILNQDGSLRALKRLAARSTSVHMDRNPGDGSMVLAAEHPFGTTEYDGHVFTKNAQGLFIFGLDSAGGLAWDRWLQGANFGIRDLVYCDNGIFIAGFFDNQLNLGPEIPTISASGQHSFVAKLDEDGHPVWSIAMPYANNNFAGSSGAIHKLHFDPYNELLIALEGGTGYSTSGSCNYSSFDVQVVAVNPKNGTRLWNQLWELDDHIRPTAIATTPSGGLWISGHTRGNIAIGDQNLSKTANYVSCSWNGFHAIMNAKTGTINRLFADEPKKAKFVFDTQYNNGVMHTASLVVTEDMYEHYITERDVNCEIQIDVRSISGRLMGSEVISVAARSSNITGSIAHLKLGLAHHVDYGYYLSVTNSLQGRVGEAYALSSQLLNANSLLIQRFPSSHIDLRAEEDLLTSDMNFLVYPNPTFSDAVFVDLSAEDKDSFTNATLFDLTGRFVHSQILVPGTYTHRIGIPQNVRSGVYVLRLEGPNGSMGEKLVIDR